MNPNIYDKKNPFNATIKERVRMSEPGSLRRTYHIVLDIKDSGYEYCVGDSMGIYSINDPQVVENTLKAMKATADVLVKDKQGAGSYTLLEFLTRHANITEISRKLVNVTAERQENSEKKTKLLDLFKEENKDHLRTYLECHQLWDFLSENLEVTFTPQELINLLMPMLPRLYSIASSQKAVGNEVHLTVSNLHFVSNGHERFGVCTHYLCDLAPLNNASVPIYVQPHHGFTLPEDIKTDIIMVGPGTGVAPFRAFMQERTLSDSTGRHWLFFGEWHEAYDYYYKDYWLDLQSKGKLQVNTAFSRDQEHKIYVQHLMLKHGAELYQWLETGAVLYVCGDAHHMAKDVDATLHEIIQTFGSKTEQEAKEYVKKMRNDKKYLRDIY